MSRAELVKRSCVSDQQLSRLENGLFRLRLDHLKPFAIALGYSPEQILLWVGIRALLEISPKVKCLPVATPRHPPTAEALVAGAICSTTYQSSVAQEGLIRLRKTPGTEGCWEFGVSSSHGENRGSSPLGSANKNNNLNKVWSLLTDRCLLFVYYT